MRSATFYVTVSEDTRLIMCCLRPGAIGIGNATAAGHRFSKVPKLFGRISVDIIRFVYSKRRRLEAGNFAVILLFIPFTTYEKPSFTELAGWSLTNGFRARNFSGLSRNRPLVFELGLGGSRFSNSFPQTQWNFLDSYVSNKCR